ncbi:hypothetical protein HMPREF1544_00948 [Mucor circinelloides 1006PhL]|uniref:Man1/Src1-like C-terminal domain-containing protein n=1 Tax=Mucor circinelloides f. circinelloides (strain 1006PhL) TaxID=1220926 RepID=S2K9K2_MUCC1|nr:hypothetical protein HMPREF1544_00948 [Mucor circinelloides 1006PhL]
MSNNPDIPDELYYLDEDFSVRSLRKYQLKDILTAHNIPYMHGITRPDLIKLFKKNIESRRDEILKQHRQAVSKEEKTDSHEEELGRGRRASQKPDNFYQDQLFLPKRRQKRPEEALKAPAKKDKDGYAIPALPSNRKKAVPAFNPEDSFDDEEGDHFTPSTSSFSVEPRKTRKAVSNGSSNNRSSTESKKPAASVAATQRTIRRSKFDPPSFNPEDSFASSDDEVIERNVRQKSPKRKTEARRVSFDNSIHVIEDEEENDPDYQADGDASDDEDEEEDLGEVEKEELVQLYKDQAVPPEELVAPDYSILTRSQTIAAAKNSVLQWKARIRQIGFVLCGIYMFFALICLGITAYARQKNGYCQNYPDIVAETPASSSIFSLLPSPCIPCPDHGICAGGELTCDTLYERKTPLYNIGHMFPIADDCIHNSVLGKYVARVERKIKNKLAIHQGESACKHLLAHADVESIEPAPIVRVLVKDILSDLKESIQPPLPTDKSDEIMVIALAAVLEDPKIHYWEIDGNRYLGTEHVQYSFTCQLQRLYKKTPFNVKMMILTFISVASAFIGASRDYKRSKKYRHKIDILVKDITERLMKQYENHLKDPIQHPSAALSVSQLRSSIVDVNDSKTISDWQKVVEKIEVHPHIRKSFQEVRGDPVEYWELTV